MHCDLFDQEIARNELVLSTARQSLIVECMGPLMIGYNGAMAFLKFEWFKQTSSPTDLTMHFFHFRSFSVT